MRRNVRKERAFKHARGFSYAGQKEAEPMPKVQPREERRYRLTAERATAQAALENIKCESCNNVALEGKKHCLHCDMYWEDCRNGLFLE